jgi:hypothetical protein
LCDKPLEAIKLLVELGYKLTDQDENVIGKDGHGIFEREFLNGKYYLRTGSNAFVKYYKFDTFEEMMESYERYRGNSSDPQFRDHTDKF